MKKKCELISDLLPLYRDGVCSAESRAAVEEHLAECEKCREELRLIEEEFVSAKPAPAEEKAVKAAKKAWKTGRKKSFLIGAVCTVLLIVLGLGADIIYHYATSVDKNDITGLEHIAAEKLAEHRSRFNLPQTLPAGLEEVRGELTSMLDGQYQAHIDDGKRTYKIVKTDEKMGCIAALMTDGEGHWRLQVFYRDIFFKKRFHAGVYGDGIEGGRISGWGVGQNYTTFYYFYGGDLPKEAASYEFSSGDITYNCKITDGTVLGFFAIPTDGSFTSFSLINLLDKNGNEIATF